MANHYVLGIGQPKATSSTPKAPVLDSGGTAFSTALRFDADYDMGIYFVAGPIAFTADLTGAVAGKGTRVTLIADGVNAPTMPVGSTYLASDYGYANTLGYQNILQIVWSGAQVLYQYVPPGVQTVITQPVAPAFSVAPSIIGTPQEGVASAFTLGTLSAGSPTPTRTRQWTVDNVVVATTATYTPTSGDVGKALRVIDIATNASGTASSTSSPATVTAAGSLDPAVTAWLARVATNSGTVSSGTQTAVNNLVLAAKAGTNYWSLLDRVNLFAGDANASVVPLKVETSGAALDVLTSYTYAEATGMTAAGASSYITTGYTPSTGAVGGMSGYLRTTQASDTNIRTLMGCRDAGSTSTMRIAGNLSGTGSASAGSVYGAWGGPAASQSATTGGLTQGFYQASRTTATSMLVYKNGSQILSTVTNFGANSPGQPVVVGAVNAGGTIGSYLASGSALGGYALDLGMSAAQMAQFYTDMQAFQTAMGRQV